MLRAIACTLFVATTVSGCRQATLAPDGEQTAPPDQFAVTTNAGTRLTGAAARIDIKHADPAKEPDVEVIFSASGSSGLTWSVQSAAPPQFLETLTLTARVVDVLEPGNASVQVRLPSAEATAARSGLLSLRLHAGRLVGEASRMDDAFAATFEGPFVVTCAVPAASIAVGAPTGSEGTQTTLVVDEAFASALCKPYAALGGWSR